MVNFKFGRRIPILYLNWRIWDYGRGILKSQLPIKFPTNTEIFRKMRKDTEKLQIN